MPNSPKFCEIVVGKERFSRESGNPAEDIIFDYFALNHEKGRVVRQTYDQIWLGWIVDWKALRKGISFDLVSLVPNNTIISLKTAVSPNVNF